MIKIKQVEVNSFKIKIIKIPELTESLTKDESKKKSTANYDDNSILQKLLLERGRAFCIVDLLRKYVTRSFHLDYVHLSTFQSL